MGEPAQDLPPIDFHLLDKPLEKEEFSVNVDPATGIPRSFRHALAEETPGADLSQDQARGIATAFLLRQGYDLARYETDRNHPEVKGTSRLSPYLHFGCISSRELGIQ